jgi:uncharacterized membrane protein
VRLDAPPRPPARAEVWLFTALRLFLAGLFAYASLDKIAHPDQFAAILRDYRLLPQAAVPFTAVVLPWLEAVLALALILEKWREGALFLSVALLAVFWASLAVNMARGLNVSCGCFSTAKDGGGDMAWYLVRDGFFVLAGLAAWHLGVWRRRRSPGG